MPSISYKKLNTSNLFVLLIYNSLVSELIYRYIYKIWSWKLDEIIEIIRRCVVAFNLLKILKWDKDDYNRLNWLLKYF